MAHRGSKEATVLRTTLVAPCGMNCGLCIAYRRKRNACPGCRGDDSVKAKTRVRCKIKTCEKIVRDRLRFCFSCEDFPCAPLNHLDQRYRSKYGMSMLDNLENIRKSGIRKFVRDEVTRWTCPSCGEMLCVHTSRCPGCEFRWH